MVRSNKLKKGDRVQFVVGLRGGPEIITGVVKAIEQKHDRQVIVITGSDGVIHHVAEALVKRAHWA